MFSATCSPTMEIYRNDYNEGATLCLIHRKSINLIKELVPDAGSEPRTAYLPSFVQLQSMKRVSWSQLAADADNVNNLVKKLEVNRMSITKRSHARRSSIESWIQR